jgi:hypothetical protein
MRAKEFITDDVADTLLKGIRETLNQSPELFEDTIEYAEFKNFIDLHYKQPVLGEEYYLICVMCIPPAKIVSVAHTANPATLVESSGKRNIFQLSTISKKSFPDYLASDDLLQVTLAFSDKQEKEQTLMLLHVKFGAWRLSMKGPEDASK